VSREEVQEAWGTWLSGMASWEWFVTLTLRDPPEGMGAWTRPGWATAKKARSAFMQAVQPAVGELQAVWAWEIQKGRGVPHLHGLIARQAAEVRRMDMVDWGWRSFGITRVLQYDPSRGASYYLSKYLTKDLADIEFFGLRNTELERTPEAAAVSGSRTGAGGGATSSPGSPR